MRAVEERGRERIWPGETLQHECIEGIKNITRDECNSVYLAAEKEPATLCCVTLVVRICSSSNQSIQTMKTEKMSEKQTEVFIAWCFCCWCVKEEPLSQ